jgi:hypothetical protein
MGGGRNRSAPGEHHRRSARKKAGTPPPARRVGGDPKYVGRRPEAGDLGLAVFCPRPARLASSDQSASAWCGRFDPDELARGNGRAGQRATKPRFQAGTRSGTVDKTTVERFRRTGGSAYRAGGHHEVTEPCEGISTHRRHRTTILMLLSAKLGC